MGLFKFIKEAGAKIFGGSAAAATPEKLQQEVQGHGFDATKLGIQVEGDKVKLSGQATNQEEAEKIILSLGNTYGVAEVDTTELKVAAAVLALDHVHGPEGRYSLGDRREALRQGQGREIYGNRQGQFAAGQGSRPDPAGLGAPDPAAGLNRRLRSSLRSRYEWLRRREDFS